ncbi:40S ribosomal protein S15 [Cyclospora cayetanensis]|uniref:40S ribosomal protein S15 n=1 Tax=Cyclospora cayetanensis TaxID=88456 RepID=A0A6P6RXJ1_9EIME|nr:40S ribosomal protein S15 [Cyclospora cayetanensis]
MQNRGTQPTMSNPELISLNLSLAKRRQLWEVYVTIPQNSTLSGENLTEVSLAVGLGLALPRPVNAERGCGAIGFKVSAFEVLVAEDASAPRKRTFRTFSYRGVDLEKLVTLPLDKLVDLLRARQRRKFSRGINMKALPLMNKLRNAKKHLPYGEKPPVVNTHLRNVVVVPEMIGSVIGIYNGKQFINVEIKPEMVGYYLGEFSMSYKPVRHGKPGIGATHSSRFIPLK